MNDLQGCAQGTLGVLLVRRGPAEVCQDAITHVAGDKTLIARDHVAAEGSIRMQQAAQLFGVELFTQRRRTHEIAKHDGELAAFARRWRRKLVLGRPGRRWCAVPQLRDRYQQLAPVAHSGNAEFLEIVRGQMA
jgi:hypothetical protein